MKREDIMQEPKEEKERVYLRIDTLFQLGVPVSIKEHKSGFPAVTVDCGDVHVLTDILSPESSLRQPRGVVGEEETNEHKVASGICKKCPRTMSKN